MAWFRFVSFRFVSFGSVWFGLVWFGLVWFGLVWFGLAWFGLNYFGLVRVNRLAMGGWATDEPDRRAEKDVPRGAGANGGSNHARDEETPEHGRLQLPGDHRARGFRRGVILNDTKSPGILNDTGIIVQYLVLN